MRKAFPIMFAVSILFVVGAHNSFADSTYYDATSSLIDLNNPVGTTWHELYPNYCDGPYEIIDWRDNGDGELSPCDTIDMQGPGGETDVQTQHVVEVTYTLELTPLQEPIIETFWDYTFHEQAGDPLTEPVCSWWHEVYPEFSTEWHIAAWEDNGSGRLDSCDVIVDDTGHQFHVEGVHTDIITEPVDGNPTDEPTWGRIKSLFR